DSPGCLGDAWSKLRGYGARLAVIVHELRRLAEPGLGAGIDGETMSRAAALIAYFQAQARRAWCAMGADPQAAAALEVLDWLERQPGLRDFSRTWLHSQLRGRPRFATARTSCGTLAWSPTRGSSASSNRSTGASCSTAAGRRANRPWPPCWPDPRRCSTDGAH